MFCRPVSRRLGVRSASWRGRSSSHVVAVQCLRLSPERPQMLIGAIRSVLGRHESAPTTQVDLADLLAGASGLCRESLMRLRFIAAAHPEQPLATQLGRELTVAGPQAPAPDLRDTVTSAAPAASRRGSELDGEPKATAIHAAVLWPGFAWSGRYGARRTGTRRPKAAAAARGRERWADLYLCLQTATMPVPARCGWRRSSRAVTAMSKTRI